MNNYHTHTFRCHHAEGDISDYISHAEQYGLGELGFSDHLPFPDDLWSDHRMLYSQQEEYLSQISQAKKTSSIQILAGFECEWREDMATYLKDLVPQYNLDYLITGVHWVPFDGSWLSTTTITTSRELYAFTDYTIASIRSGLFVMLAHPDIFCASWPKWNADAIACSRAILQASAQYAVPVEINGYGLRKPYIHSADGYRPLYPFNKFWELASEYNVTVMVNSDAHRPQDVAANLEEASAIAQNNGLILKERLISRD